MNVKSIIGKFKFAMAVALATAAFGALTAGATETGGGEEMVAVTVDVMAMNNPWRAITVNCTLVGVDAATEYKVVFAVTAGEVTKAVTNAATKLTNGMSAKTIDTAALFGGTARTDVPMKVRVSLFTLTQTDGVQLWDGGPLWAEKNIGATAPEDYGITCYFDDAPQEVSNALGESWRVPTKAELQALCDNCTPTWTTRNGANGYLFTSKTNGKSVFLPVPENKDVGSYWTSEIVSSAPDFAWFLKFSAALSPYVTYIGLSASDVTVRAVCEVGESEVAFGEHVIDLVSYSMVDGLSEALSANPNLVGSSPMAQGGDYILKLDNGDGSTDYVHVFLTAGEGVTFTTEDDITARVMLVGGGGGGGTTGASGSGGGGGGGGGAVVEESAYSLEAGTYDIAIGIGGTGGAYWNVVTGDGGAGGMTTLALGDGTSLRAEGGGGGGTTWLSATGNGNGGDGACGGGAGGHVANAAGDFLGGRGDPGYNGGSSATSEKCRGAGGGGMGSAGESSVGTKSGNGGDGIVSDILGYATCFGGGGAGGTDTKSMYGLGGAGGGASGSDATKNGNAGTRGLGGGGAGASSYDKIDGTGGNGGSGAVIIRYTVGGNATPKAKVPTAIKGLVYTGLAQTGVEAKTGSTLSDDFAATDAGDYTATATLAEGYEWADGYEQVSRTIAWSIAKATPVLSGELTISNWEEGSAASEPSGLSADFGEIVYN